MKVVALLWYGNTPSSILRIIAHLRCTWDLSVSFIRHQSNHGTGNLSRPRNEHQKTHNERPFPYHINLLWAHDSQQTEHMVALPSSEGLLFVQGKHGIIRPLSFAKD